MKKTVTTKINKSAKIRECCQKYPYKSAKEILKLAKLPYTTSNQQAVCAARRYIKNGTMLVPTKSQRADKTNRNPKLSKFYAIASVCMQYGTDSVISVAKAMQEAEKKL